MEEPAHSGLESLELERCPRCLQPVPPKSARCPECRQPLHSARMLPLAIGAAGLLVLIFALLVMLRISRNEELLRAPVPEDSAPKQGDLFQDNPPPVSPSKEPAKPEKPPPLNEPQ